MKIFLFILFAVIFATVTLKSPKIYDAEDGLHMEWRADGGLDLDIPDSWNCAGTCEDERADRCSLGYCFELCFDTDKDFYVSEKEIDAALKKNLSWLERMVTFSAPEWITKFDGADGSAMDKKISASELNAAVDVECKDLIDMRTYLCDRCPQFA